MLSSLSLFVESLLQSSKQYILTFALVLVFLSRLVMPTKKFVVAPEFFRDPNRISSLAIEQKRQAFVMMTLPNVPNLFPFFFPRDLELSSRLRLCSAIRRRPRRLTLRSTTVLRPIYIQPQLIIRSVSRPKQLTGTLQSRQLVRSTSLVCTSFVSALL